MFWVAIFLRAKFRQKENFKILKLENQVILEVFNRQK
jgi:hypothetical protein